MFALFIALECGKTTYKIQYNPKSVISVMMITSFIFEQMFCRFE